MDRLTAQWGENHAVPTEFALDFAWDMSNAEWQGLTRVIDRLAEFEDAEEARNKGCDFCLDPDGDSCDNNIYIDHTHGAAITTHDVYVPINFCPMCGRKLSEVTDTKK